MKTISVGRVFAFVLAAGIAIASSSDAGWGGDPIAPIHAPFRMPALSRPVFDARVVNIVDHGAIAGGEIKNTEAFAKAIKACADAGGGRVLVPAGRWLTGPIHLRSGIELHLAENAEVVFSDRFDDYLPVVPVRVGGIELYNYSPFIYARDCRNVGITGPGRLNGNAEAWWAWSRKETKEIFQLEPKGIPVEQRIFGTEAAAIRPNFVVFWKCENVLMEGFTIGSGANWTIHPIYCENVIIRRVNVVTAGPNNDGIDPDSCRNVLIEHCVFDTRDDCVVLKSGYNEDGWRVGRPTENVVMRWCSSKRGHGGLVIGSEMSGDVRNVYVHDCDFEGTDRAVRIKSRRDRGGIVEKIYAENLRVKDLKHEVAIISMEYTADRNKTIDGKPPRFRDIHFRNITGSGAPVAIRLQGLEDSPIENVIFEDVTIASTKGVIANHVKNLSFRNVSFTPKESPVFALNNAVHIAIIGAKAPAGTEVFLALEGESSRDVLIESSDLSAAKSPFSLGPGVAVDAVTRK
jgi:hypothetical protein